MSPPIFPRTAHRIGGDSRDTDFRLHPVPCDCIDRYTSKLERFAGNARKNHQAVTTEMSPKYAGASNMGMTIVKQRRRRIIATALLVLLVLALIIIFDISVLWFVVFVVNEIVGWIEWTIGCVGYYIVSILFPETP